MLGLNQIRSFVAGSSTEAFWIGDMPVEPRGLREVQAGAVREIGASVWATRIAIVCSGCLALAGCSDDPVARRTTAVSGVTEVQTTGYAFFGCGEHDVFHTGFVGRGADGSCIEGVVCSGLFKGATMRITGPSNACPTKSGVR